MEISTKTCLACAQRQVSLIHSAADFLTKSLIGFSEILNLLAEV